MPYKDPTKQKEAVLQAVRRHRVLQGEQKDEGITDYPAIVYALIDPIKREKLQRICKSLDKKLSDGSNLLNIVHYGTSDYIPMSKVRELLQVTA
jgi:hypothetical protein